MATPIRATGQKMSGVCLHVIGDHNEVEGTNCRVEGNHNTVRGTGCIVVGDDNSVSGTACRATGKNNYVTGLGSVSVSPAEVAVRTSQQSLARSMIAAGTALQDEFAGNPGALVAPPPPSEEDDDDGEPRVAVFGSPDMVVGGLSAPPSVSVNTGDDHFVAVGEGATIVRDGDGSVAAVAGGGPSMASSRGSRLLTSSLHGTRRRARPAAAAQTPIDLGAIVRAAVQQFGRQQQQQQAGGVGRRRVDLVVTRGGGGAPRVMFRTVRAGGASASSSSAAAGAAATVQDTLEKILDKDRNLDESSDGAGDEDPNACPLCYARYKCVTFVPCGHIVACVACSLQHANAKPGEDAKCPLCNKVIAGATFSHLP